MTALSQGDGPSILLKLYRNLLVCDGVLSYKASSKNRGSYYCMLCLRYCSFPRFNEVSELLLAYHGSRSIRDNPTTRFCEDSSSHVGDFQFFVTLIVIAIR